MVKEIVLDGYPIEIIKFEYSRERGPLLVSVEFPVTSESYHDVTTLLYKGEFDVTISGYPPFRGKVVQYSTSVTNLYESGQVGQFKLALIEVKN
ncbi:DUF3219 family protein [Bacillus sp. ISL-35]|nr:DUF3219 family protein [Bacillus sp. ISL-35]MBT2679533.1 DUF3219 family protein [Bacillus sp. ISL-35]MBT2703436.1 DUF3219 family protein [Chryseobacterium sp. ISL-80]